MQHIFEDDTKLELFEQIQKNLNSLELNTTDDKIQKLIDQIPKDLLTNKDDLKVICELFAIYARNCVKSKKGNIYKLFRQIMNYIKIYLQDESIFFWMIFGGLYNFKLFMYEEGLISIETIILAVKKDQDHSILEYFFPEIIEKEPEIFEKELKDKISCPYTPEHIEEFKILRQKYINWICESGDYNDPIYREIETDKLRYAMVTDDIDSFQKIISQSNMDINSKIKESLIQNSHAFYSSETLLEFALEYKSFNISKFLIMNDATYTTGLYFSSINSDNYEMIHHIESKMPEKFPQFAIKYSISNWDDELIQYLLNEYEIFDFLEKSDTDITDKNLIYTIIKATFNFVNISFLRRILIPFFRNNSKFVRENVNEIMSLTFSEKSGYMANQFINHPDLDVNYYSEEEKCSILGNAIQEENAKAVEILIENEKIDINKIAFKDYTPLIFAVGNFADMKIIEMLCKNPQLDVNLTDKRWSVNAFQISVSRGNFIALNYLIDNFEKLDTSSFGCLFFFTLKEHHLMTCKNLLMYYLKIYNEKNYDKVAKSIQSFHFHAEYKEEYLNDFKQVYDEVTENILD